MNKIYKVIWSKVKNQYVVVSELAHSSGKQSRTSRSSIRSRIAALVVCGAIAAFGVLPMNSASAAVNVKAGDGIEVDQGWNTTISIKLVKDENEKLESGLTFDTNGGLKVDTGSGLIIKDNKVVIDLASGQGIGGLGFTDDGKLKVETGAGLKINEQGQVALNVNTNNNSGLTFDEKNNELKVNTGSALEVNNNQVNVKLAESNSGLDATNGLAVKLAKTDSGLTATSDGLKVNTGSTLEVNSSNQLDVKLASNSGLDTANGLAVKLAETDSGLTATSEGLKVQTGAGLTTDTEGLKVNVKADSGLTADDSGLGINLDNKTLSAGQSGLAVKLAATDSGLTADEDGLKVNVKANSGLTADDSGLGINLDSKTLSVGQTGQLAVKLADNSGLGTTTDGLAVKLAKTDSGLTATSEGLKVNVQEGSGLEFDENGALSIDKDAFSTGSTNVKAGTNIDVADDGTVSLEPNVTLDADTKDGNKIDLNGTNGTISAVNSNEKSFLGWESKATNTFDFDENGGKFESVKETTTKEYITGITLSKNIIRNTAEFNEDGATFETNKVDTGKLIDGTLPSAVSHKTEFNENGATFTKNQFDLGEDIDKILSSSSTNIDGGTITLSSGILGDKNKVVIDGTKQEVSGLSNTTWNANDAKDSTKAATEAQLYTVADALEESNGLNVKYDSENKQKVTLGGENSAPVELKNVKAGELGQNSTDAVNGSQLYKTNEQVSSLETTVNNGWTATDGKGGTVNVTPKDGENTLQFNGDKNIDVTAADGAINVGLKPVVTLDGDTEDSNKVVLDGENGTISVTNEHTTKGPARTITNEFKFDNEGATFTNTTKNGHGDGWGNPEKSSTNIDGGTITTDTVKGLNNTTWTEKDKNAVLASINGEDKTEATKAATQAQLLGATGAISEELNTLSDFAVKYDEYPNGRVNKNSITLDGGKYGTQIHNVADGVAPRDAVNVSQLIGKTGDLQYNNFYDDAKSIVKNNDNLTTAVGKLDDAIQKTSETANKGWTANAGNKDINVKSGDTLQFKGDNNITVSATTDIFGNNAINVGLEPVVTLDGNKLDGDSIVLNGNDGTINAVNSNVDIKTDYEWKLGHIIPSKVTTTTTTTSNKFNFDENGGKFVTTEDQIKVSTDISDNSITKVTHTADFNGDGATFTKTEGIILKNSSTTNIDGGTITTDKVQDLDNTTWNKDIAKAVAENEDLQGIAATQGQLQTVDSKVNAGWIATDGKTNVNVNPNNNTLKFAGDDNITVTATTDEKGNNAINVKLDDDITLGNGEDAINIDGNNGTLSIGNKFAVDKDGNVSSAGDVTAAGGKYSLSEVSQYAVRYDDNNGVVNTGKITLAGPNGTTIANVADAKNPDEAVNLRQLKDVEATASAGWTAKTGDDTITVKPNQILNFEGDGNITVSATSGTSSELKFGLNDTVVLGDAVPTEEGGSAASLALSSDGSYVPPTATDDDKSETGIIGSHGGGFILYSTNSAGNPMFGVTADGVVHANDVISYTNNPDSNSKDKIVKYSLNNIGDIVTQIAHGQYDKTGMEYTLISDFKNETDKEDPFEALPDKEGETAERTIGLAVRQDGAVVVGAIVDEEGKLAESGIRINDDTNAGGGKDTITGLANTTWTPPTNNSMARTNGDTRIDSMAATLGQLDDLYDSVVGYNVDENGSVNPNHVTLKGEEKYTFTTDANGTKTYSGGVKLDNVAYAVTDTASTEYNGSAAVNVDLLKDTVADVTSQASNSDRYLTSGKLDGNTLSLTVSDLNGYNNVITIGDIASRSEVNNQIASINRQIKDINTKIENIGTGTGGNNNTDITGGRVDETGNLVLKKDDGSEVKVGQLTDSAVSDVKFDKEKGTLTITNKDNYTGKESGTPITVEGIASKDDIKTVNDTIGVTSKEDLKEKYKDADTAYITDSETMVDADIALDHAVQDLASNDQYLNSRIDSVEKRLGDVEQRIDKVGAMAAAIANLRTMGFDPEAPTEIAVGVGQYKSETGLAIGVFHYPNQDFMLSASLSTSGDEVMGGIGATWRIGRKTAAEKAKDEEKRILAKAEEIKQAAKRAEVKAQADRHAKLLAEREAKGESIRPIENKVEQTQEQA